MPEKTEALLIGRLFGAPNTLLNELFTLHQISDFVPAGDIPRETAKKLCAVAVGMVGSGHTSTVAVDGAFLDTFPSLEFFWYLGLDATILMSRPPTSGA